MQDSLAGHHVQCVLCAGPLGHMQHVSALLQRSCCMQCTVYGPVRWHEVRAAHGTLLGQPCVLDLVPVRIGSQTVCIGASVPGHPVLTPWVVSSACGTWSNTYVACSICPGVWQGRAAHSVQAGRAGMCCM